MKDADLLNLIRDYVNGEISPERHRALQERLKADPHARTAFREFMDLEAGLRTWAAESTAPSALAAEPEVVRIAERRGGRGQRRWSPAVIAVVAVAASIAFIVFPTRLRQPDSPQFQPAPPSAPSAVSTVAFLGTVRQEGGCVWNGAGALTPDGRFSSGGLLLASGIAALQFTSGTELVLEGPCELQIVRADAARLARGQLVVNVSELSDGFTLETPDATIIDEGTEYAVALDHDSTEIHVFEGSVLWEPVGKTSEAKIERIEQGEARRYLRSGPSSGSRIPFGMRRFARKLEADVLAASGADLLAYDGFENLAGHVRRGRSGFGWAGGWESGFRGRGKIATITDAPGDTVFGMDRTGRRLLQLSSGDAIRRTLASPLAMEPGSTYYISFLLRRAPGSRAQGRFFQITLSGDGQHRGRNSRRDVAMGITSDGFPFVNSANEIARTAPPVEDAAVYFCVGKLLASVNQEVAMFLRVYQPGESIDLGEPTIWTTAGTAGPSESSLGQIRMAVGVEATYEVDELRIGTTWQSVTFAGEPPPSSEP